MPGVVENSKDLHQVSSKLEHLRQKREEEVVAKIEELLLLFGDG